VVRCTPTIAIWIGYYLQLALCSSGCGTGSPGTARPDGAGGQDGGGSQDGGGEGGGIDAALPDADDVGVRFARDIFPIVRDRCATPTCHGTSTLQNHWTDFSTAASTHTRWVNGIGFDFCAEPEAGIYVQRVLVIPGVPEQSFLVEKLASTREEPCRDAHHPRMPPPPMPPLASDQITSIVTWIREGAAND
jgi:hypothetical protein